MGILDDDDLMEIAQLVEEANKFKPQELNEDNVRAIFERCLAKEDEPSTFAQVLQKALSGKESDVVRFSQAKISENSKNISYLLGQLKAVHKKEGLMLLEYGIMTYNGKKWTTSADNLLKLYELGMVNISLTPFSIQDDKTLVTDINTITPTLSPKDPAFPAWWEAHKAEWETQ